MLLLPPPHDVRIMGCREAYASHVETPTAGITSYISHVVRSAVGMQKACRHTSLMLPLREIVLVCQLTGSGPSDLVCGGRSTVTRLIMTRPNSQLWNLSSAPGRSAFHLCTEGKGMHKTFPAANFAWCWPTLASSAATTVAEPTGLGPTSQHTHTHTLGGEIGTC